MKTLPTIRPTPEQLPLISDNSLGVEVIRGAAGSGKTSTAILRLRSLAYMIEEGRDREGDDRPVNILVLTFNRTLSGYVQTLVNDQVDGLRNSSVTVDTFGRWAMRHLGFPDVIKDSAREAILKRLAGPLAPPSPAYIVKEVDYLLGRFRPDDLDRYLTAERTGRGAEPRVDRPLRQRILNEVVRLYRDELASKNLIDWNDVAVQMADHEEVIGYDIVIVDESQDFSANQLRAIRQHISEDFAITFVIDTVQRIYARGFTWTESGFDMRGARYHSLRENHRNTRQIAAFAAGILTNIAAEADGALPNLAAASRDGPKPKILQGLYSKQVDWALAYIRDNVDLNEETVGFLAPQGGNFFGYLRQRLSSSGIGYVEITREAEWPNGPENVALSTFHSAKGLEFDYVFILGLSNLNTGHGEAALDDQLLVLRRLLAVAIARGRNAVVVGYKPGEESRLIDYFQTGTFEAETV